MTLKEINEAIKKKQEEIKELKRLRETMVVSPFMWDPIREEFYEEVGNGLEAIKSVKHVCYIQSKYTGYDSTWRILNGRYAASQIWKRFKTKATRKIMHSNVGSQAMSKEDFEKVVDLINAYKDELMKEIKEEP